MRLQRLRARRPEWQRRLLASLAAVGQQTPIVGVAVENQAALLGDRTPIDTSRLCNTCAEIQCKALIWPMSEASQLWC